MHAASDIYGWETAPTIEANALHSQSMFLLVSCRQIYFGIQFDNTRQTIDKMMDFQIKRTGRRCHETDRELNPGESFYSELIDEEGEPQRRDISDEAWKGPHENSIGWWRARVPKIEGGKVYWAPRKVLLSYFESLQQHERHRPAAYVMALLMVRKRILKLVDSTEQKGQEYLEVHYSKDNKTWSVPVVELTGEQAESIQQDLAQQLFTDHPPE